MVAQTVQELRTALPEADDLLAGLLRVAEGTRIVLEVDGAGLTLAHEAGPPRGGAATDAAMELLAQVQHDFGEGPYLQAYAQDRAVMVQDLGAAPVWVRLAAVVGRLRVLAVGGVPIRLAPQPVGARDLSRSHPRAWTTHELEGAGEFAAVAGELVHNGVALAAQRLEVGQLRQALTSRVWMQQAKGSWPPPRPSTPRWPSSCCGPGPGRPRARWPRSPRRLSRTPNASGWAPPPRPIARAPRH